jgi:L-threonylcarbamoyladenylate synthase
LASGVGLRGRRLTGQCYDMSPVEIAVAALRRGGIVAFPTDTYYGLGANVFDAQAVERILAAKGRPPSSPLPVLLADAGDVEKVCLDPPPELERLAEAFWPGPLTVVAPALHGVAHGVTAGHGTVGVRVPDHEIPRSIARQLGSPLTGTSANLSGNGPHKTGEAVEDELGDHVDYVVPGDCGTHAAASTVVDLCGNSPVVLRDGAISLADLKQVLPGIRRQGDVH